MIRQARLDGEPMQKHLDRLVATTLLPGAVLAIREGERRSMLSAGKIAEGVGPALEPDAIFRIASLSKPLTSVAALLLVQDGKLRLDDPVNRWLPELAGRRVLARLGAALDDTVPAHRDITVEDLLTSRMGLGIVPAAPNSTPIQREILRLGLAGFGPPDPANPKTGDQWIAGLGQLPLLAQPGAQWFYSTSYNVLGVLVSRVSGEAFSSFLDERILAPLGMGDTGFFVPPGKRHRLTTAYAADMSITDNPRQSAWSQPPAFETGEGGLVSTAADFMAFVDMLHRQGQGADGPLLQPELLRSMLSDHLSGDQRQAAQGFLDGRGWGYGVSVDTGRQPAEAFAGEAGWAGGLGTSWTSRFDRDRAVVILGCRAIDHPDVYRAHQEMTEHALGS